MSESLAAAVREAQARLLGRAQEGQRAAEARLFEGMRQQARLEAEYRTIALQVGERGRGAEGEGSEGREEREGRQVCREVECKGSRACVVVILWRGRRQESMAV